MKKMVTDMEVGARACSAEPREGPGKNSKQRNWHLRSCLKEMKE